MSSQYEINWDKTIGTPVNDHNQGIVVDEQGNINIATSSALGKILSFYQYNEHGQELNSLENVLPQESQNGYYTAALGELAKGINGELIYTGTVVPDTRGVQYGSTNQSLVKITSDFTVGNNREYISTGNKYGGSTAVDQSGDIYIAGLQTTYPANYTEGLLTKLDGTTNSIDWSNVLAPPTSHYYTDSSLTDVEVDSSGNIYATAYSHNPSDNHLYKVNDSGVVLWEKNLGGGRGSDGYSSSVTLDSNDNAYALNNDGVLQQFAPDGTPGWSTDLTPGNDQLGFSDLLMKDGNIYGIGRQSDVTIDSSPGEPIGIIEVSSEGNINSFDLINGLPVENWHFDRFSFTEGSGENEFYVTGNTYAENGWDAYVAGISKNQSFSDERNFLDIEGTYSGTLDGVAFSDVKEIDLGGGTDDVIFHNEGGYMDRIDGGDGDNDGVIFKGDVDSDFHISSNRLSSDTYGVLENFEAVIFGEGRDSVQINDINGNQYVIEAGGLPYVAEEAPPQDDTISSIDLDLLTISGINHGIFEYRHPGIVDDGSRVEFKGFENVQLGDRDDLIVIEPGGRLTGFLDAGAGHNTLQVPSGTEVDFGNIGGIGEVIVTPPGGGGGGGGGQPPSNKIVGSSSVNQVHLTGGNSGVIDGTTFSDIQDIDLKAGNDTATVDNNGYLDGVLDGGSGIDKLVFNTNDSAGHIRVEEGGVINSLSDSIANPEPIYQNFEVIELLGGDDVVDVLAYSEDADINNLSSYEIDGGDGFDDIHIDLSDVLFAQLDQGEINQLRTFIDDPNGKILDIDFGSGDLKAENFERAFINQSFNEAPVAEDDLLSLEAGSMKLAEVLSNDSDPDGDDLTITSFSDNSGVNGFASLVGDDIQIDASFYADMLPGSDDLTELVDYTISDGELTDAAQITVTITAPDADGTVISTSLADFDSISSDLHGSIIGINAAAVDVDGSATVQTPVVLNSDSSASVVSGDAKAVADTTSIEGITDSSFEIASDLDMAASVQSTLDSSATSTNGIAVSSSLIGAQQGIELTDVGSVDAVDVGGIANISVGSSMSAASVAETVGNGSGNSGSLGVDGSWSNAIADDHLGLGSGDLGGILGIDVASDASISSSLASSLSADATADAGVAVSNVALNASTSMEDLAVEVGGLGLVSSINQSELDSTASSTTDDASAIGLNELASGILNSDFNFSDVDSVMSAQTVSEMDVDASTTTGDAWSSLDSASVGFEGATTSITGAAEITAIASDQGFAESATVAGQATAIADQSAIGMDGYSINNSSDLQLTALAEVDSTADSSATMV
ncbi:hypothetical protein SynPROS91_02407 [Synechococcus sp. PROS-9-1]|uniref:Ig-like domain-containing protein n=1 Tax=Synechococcus sp. PROS-9-1 TaxID=1968775 RepID=UPI00164872A4|nr:hypothetical protein [Synechococcus sp. PROS-9-1]QNJ32757.1 hypothetical protein SynPROS91_02407 [Synechococcus sp. PROS-9-1]